MKLQGIITRCQSSQIIELTFKAASIVNVGDVMTNCSAKYILEGRRSTFGTGEMETDPNLITDLAKYRIMICFRQTLIE